MYQKERRKKKVQEKIYEIIMGEKFLNLIKNNNNNKIKCLAQYSPQKGTFQNEITSSSIETGTVVMLVSAQIVLEWPGPAV